MPDDVLLAEQGSLYPALHLTLPDYVRVADKTSEM